nr:putative ribonuclease H-like domain-containing protein [Tanacetum cinerariifolium]
MDSLSTPVVSATKLPILNPNEFDLWKMRIEQYFLMTDYSLWEVIINGDSPAPTVVIDGVVRPVTILSVDQKLARRNELKARGTLLMALPDKHQLKFNSHKDAKTPMQAIEKRFRGNTETKKVQKTLLKQQFENFTGSSSKNLDQIHDRLNKADLKEHSLDDVFNSLRIYEAKVKQSSTPGNPTKNLAFVSSSNSDSTTDSVSAATSVSAIDVDDLEKIDLRWQMAMLTMRARRECRSPKDTRTTGAAEPQRRTTLVENSTSNALVSQCDGIRSYDWSYQAEEEHANFALMAITSSSSSSDNEISPAKPAQDMSHTTRPMAPIIEDWVSDSEDESEPNDPQNVPSFIHTFEHVKPSGHSDQPVEAPILAATPKPTSPKTNGSGKRQNRKTCFMCRGVDHLIKNCNFHAKPKTQLIPRNYSHKGYNKQHASFTKKYPQNHIVLAAVLTKSKPVSVTAIRPVSTDVPKTMITRPRHAHSLNKKSNLTIRRHKTRSQSLKTSNSSPKVTAAKASMVSAVKEKKGKWVWRPKCPILDHDLRTTGASLTLKRFNYNDALGRSKAKWWICCLGGNPKGGKISVKEKIKTGKLDFKDVYFVKELKFNLFSVSQMCDKKNKVLFTNTECLVLSPDFKLPDESQVLLRVPRENNMYNVNLKDIVPSGDLTCLFAKARIDESNLWYRRLGYINFKTINKLVKGNLVRGLPTKVFKNHNTSVACKKGKQHRASCKTKPVRSINQPLFRLHMDLFGPTFVKIINKKSYCLVITDDYSRFTWVFFLSTKDETSPILTTFITGLENQLSLKGIKREFSVPRTPQQNGIAERKNRTLIEAARTMLADSLLPIPFWAKAVNTACYVQNRVLVTKPHNKTPYELLHGRTPSIGFMRPFGCPVTILNTLDSLGKFKGKVDEGFLVGYSVNSKAFRVFNSRTCIVQKTLHVNFLENKSNIAGTGPIWLFDIDSLTMTMNYQPVTTGNQSNPSAGFQGKFDAGKVGEEANQQYMLFPVWSTGSLNPHNKEGDAAFNGKEHDAEKPESAVNVSPSSSALSGEQDDMTKKKAKRKSHVESFTRNRDLNANFEDYSEDINNNVSAAGPIVPTAGQNYSNSTNPISVAGLSNSNTSPTHGKSSLRDAYKPPDMLERDDIAYFDNENVGAEADFNNLETSITVRRASSVQNTEIWILVDLPHGKREIGTKWVYRNKKDEGGIVVRNKARLVAQGHTQEEGIDYKEVFAPVAKIKAIRLFLAYASFIGFMVYQMDVKSAFLYGTIEEEVYVYQPLGFEDPDYLDKVYKVVKALYGLHQAPRACQDKYVAEILKKFGLTEGKSASTPIDTEKPLLKDPDGEDVDVHIYRSMIGSLMYLTSSRPDIMFAQCKKQTVVATSSIEAEYVAGASCFAQSNDVTRLQALVDKKKVVVTEAAIRDALHLDDAEGVDCLPNEEIFTELARIGYEKPFTKLRFYKAFFLSQWKFLIHTILHSMSAKRTSWNEFSSAMALAVICMSIGDLSTHTIKYISPALTQKVFANMRRVGKGYLGVETPLFEGMLVAREPKEQGDAEEQAQPQGADFPMSLLQEALDACAALARRVEHLEHDKVAQDLEIIKLKTRVKKLERTNKVKTLKLRRLRKVGTSKRVDTSDDTLMEDVSNQGRIIDKLDKDKGAVLMNEKEEIEEVRDNTGDAQVEGRQADIYQIDMDYAAKVLMEVVTTAKLITEVVAAVSETVSAAAVVPTVTAAPVKVDVPSTKRRRGVIIRDPEEESFAKTPTETKSKDKGKCIMVEEPKPMKKKQQVELDKAYVRKLQEELNQDIDWEVAIDHVKQKAKEDPFIQNTKLDYFKGMSYDDIHPIFEAKFNENMEFLLKSKKQIEEEANRAIESINRTLTQKAAKRRRLNEEAKDVEELKQHLEIVPDEDDDVYIEATPLARKNFDREELESLWSLVKERFSTSKPNNFSDDYLLTILRAMFGRPDGQDQIWKIQRSVHGQATVKSWKLLYLLSRFTLDQMLNTVRLQAEEQSEMSLELIRFTRQQLQEGHHN